MLKPWAQYFGEYLSCLLDREEALSRLDPASRLTPQDQHYITHLLGSGRVRCKELGLDAGGQIDRLFGSLDTSMQSGYKSCADLTAGDIE